MFFNRAFANRRAITASLHKSECSTYRKYAYASLLLNSLYLPRLFAKVLSVLRYSTKTVLNVQEVRLRFAFVKLLVLTSPICKSAVSAALLHKNSPQRTGSTPTLYFRLSPCICSAYLQKNCQYCVTPQKTVLDVQQVRLRFAFVKLIVLTSPICKRAVSAALLHKK
ncbi:hypothetical protein HMPREF9731_01614 [Treponema denticola SP23]|nr:hypothetical protein HMPREF9731_01614 [Treponema denticola SP23]